MNARRIAGIVLLALGLLALVYGGFTYTEESHRVDLGPIEFEANETEDVDVPPWVGIALVVGGVALVAIPKR